MCVYCMSAHMHAHICSTHMQHGCMQHTYAYTLQGGSISSSEELHPSDSSLSLSFDGFTKLYASLVISRSKLLFNYSFLTSQKAYKTYLPTFSRSPQLKCYPASLPWFAPAKEASNVKTNGILNL